jgi:hypothetical protein
MSEYPVGHLQCFSRHARAGGHPDNRATDWIPAFAGMTTPMVAVSTQVP